MFTILAFPPDPSNLFAASGCELLGVPTVGIPPLGWKVHVHLFLEVVRLLVNEIVHQQCVVLVEVERECLSPGRPLQDDGPSGPHQDLLPGLQGIQRAHRPCPAGAARSDTQDL